MTPAERQRAAQANKLCGKCHNDYAFYVAKGKTLRVQRLCADCGAACLTSQYLAANFTTVGALMSSALDADRARELVDTAHAQGAPLGGFGAVPAVYPVAPPIGERPVRAPASRWDRESMSLEDRMNEPNLEEP